MNVKIILLGMIIGILCGLYCKIGIAFILLFYFIIFFICIYTKKLKKYEKVFHIKKHLTYLTIMTICYFFFIIQKETIYQRIDEIMLTQNHFEIVVIGNKIEKEYYDQYKAKVVKVEKKEVKNVIVYLNIKKKQHIKYGDILQIKGKYINPQKARNDKGFNYQNYLKSIRNTRNYKSRSDYRKAKTKSIFYFQMDR